MYWDAKLPCFGIRLSQGGAKTFVLKHDNRRITLGHFPLISLQDALTEARRLLAEFTLGHLHPQSMSVKAAIDDYLAEKAKNRRPLTVQGYRWLLYRHFRFQGRLGDITPAQITHRLAKLPPGQYNHALTVGRIFFNWCRKRRYLTNNPCDGLSPYAREPRTRVLSDEEVGRIWRCTAACLETPSELPASFARIVQFLILSGLRRGECAHIQSDHVQGNLLILPPTLTKNGREHILPLPSLAKQVLGTSSGSYVFPGRRNSAFNGWGKAKMTLDELSGVSKWTLHDIRRTVATRMAEMGVLPHVIERILNHATGTISRIAFVYNKARYIEEMRAALGLWEDRLASVIRPVEPALEAAE